MYVHMVCEVHVCFLYELSSMSPLCVLNTETQIADLNWCVTTVWLHPVDSSVHHFSVMLQHCKD